MPSLLVLSTGATALQQQGQDGRMHLSVDAGTLINTALRSAWPEGGYSCQHEALGVRSGAECSWDTLLRIRDGVVAQASQHAGVILLTGTDTMDEMAFALSLLLHRFLAGQDKAMVVTGAMRPADAVACDGPANLADAMKVAVAPEAARCGVLVCMNDSIHLALTVFKADSQLMGAFHSHPGPIGQVRTGRPHFYYQPPAGLPLGHSSVGGGAAAPCPACAGAAAAAAAAAGPGDAAAAATRAAGSAGAWCWRCLQDSALSTLRTRQLRARVVIWTVTVGAVLPPDALLQELDGLVLAGAGTGSLPQAWIDHLGAAWTRKLPIVISSRCTWGSNYDDHHYKGSKQRYLQAGFLLQGYEHLTALQARVLLVLRLSAGLSAGLPAGLPK